MRKNRSVVIFSYLGIALVLLVVGLLFIPQFVKLGKPTYNGYQIIFSYAGEFNTIRKQWPDTRPSAALIIALILMVFSIPSLLFQKKSSLLFLFGGLFIAIPGLLFLLTPLWIAIIYGGLPYDVKWLPYVVGGLMLAYGAFLTFLAIMRLRDEKNTLSSPKSHQYSYLKK